MVIVDMRNYVNDLFPQAVSLRNVCITFHLYHSAVEFLSLIAEKVLNNLLYRIFLTVVKL